MWNRELIPGQLLSILVTNFGATNATWAMDDFNYDGVVNISDLSDLASNYGDSLAPTPDVVVDGVSTSDQFVPLLQLGSRVGELPQFEAILEDDGLATPAQVAASADLAFGTASVPEPTAAAGVVAAVALLGRRRRQA